jgi:hypothetical protein
MKKIDLKKELKHLYGPRKGRIVLVEVPPMNFLMIDGKGNPNTSKAYADAVQALYALSYHLKFSCKKGAMQVDYGVMPLEGLWWSDDMEDFTAGRKDNWKWSAMIMQPDFITGEMVQASVEAVQKKKNLPGLSLTRFETFEEGTAAQTLHIGPFTEEGPTIEAVHAFIAENGLQRCGKHHEIYLSDIRRAAPEKWRTIVRQPCTGE